MKYHKNPPVVTLTEDNVEIVADKVQDRGEDVVHATKAQREDIMEKLLDFHDTLQKIHIFTVHQDTSQHPEKTHQPPVKKEQEETMEIMVKGSNNFMVTQQIM
jgi:hypothetical protein